VGGDAVNDPTEAMHRCLEAITRHVYTHGYAFCPTVEEDTVASDDVFGINEARGCLSMFLFDKDSGETDVLTLAGTRAELVLTTLLSLLDPDQQRWKRVDALDLRVQCATGEVKQASQRLVEAVQRLEEVTE
jgi:hypothetical protein